MHYMRLIVRFLILFYVLAYVTLYNQSKYPSTINGFMGLDTWENLAHSYPMDLRPSISKPLDLVKSTFPDGDCDLLDLGCGPGTHTIRLANLCRSVTALDFSKSMLSVLAHHLDTYNIKNVNPVHSDYRSFSSGSFDAVLSCYCVGMYSMEGIQVMDGFVRKLGIFIGPTNPQGSLEHRFVESLGLIPKRSFDTLDVLPYLEGKYQVSIEHFTEPRIQKTRESAFRRCLVLTDRSEESVTILKDNFNRFPDDWVCAERDVMMVSWTK